MSKDRDEQLGGKGPTLKATLREVATALRQIMDGYMHPGPAC